MISFMAPNQEDGNLVHVILWPVIGGVLILGGLVVLLYFVSKCALSSYVIYTILCNKASLLC